MKTNKIIKALKINAKLFELGLNIHSEEWKEFNFDLDEWDALVIKSGKVDFANFVSSKELTFEDVSKLVKEKGLTLSAAISVKTEEVMYYEIYEREDRTLFTCKTLQEVFNYLSDL